METEVTFDYWADSTDTVYAFPVDGSQDSYKENLGLRKLDELSVEKHLNPSPSTWTDGTQLREAFSMDLPGWRIATPAEVSTITHAAAIEAVKLRTIELRSTAVEKIETLQYLKDLGNETEQNAASLAAWKSFVIKLSAIPIQEGYPTAVNWPEIPVYGVVYETE